MLHNDVCLRQTKPNESRSITAVSCGSTWTDSVLERMRRISELSLPIVRDMKDSAVRDKDDNLQEKAFFLKLAYHYAEPGAVSTRCIRALNRFSKGCLRCQTLTAIQQGQS